LGGVGVIRKHPLAMSGCGWSSPRRRKRVSVIPGTPSSIKRTPLGLSPSHPSSSPLGLSDRHIPSRRGSLLDDSAYTITKLNDDDKQTHDDTSPRDFNHLLRSSLLSDQSSSFYNAENGSMCFCNHPKSKISRALNYSSPSKSHYLQSRAATPFGSCTCLTPKSDSGSSAPRKISRSPFKILEAPNLQDDFYLNLLDWSSTNFIAVGLGSEVYLRSSYTNTDFFLCNLSSDSDSITSVKWMQRGNILAVGTGNGDVQLWDTTKREMIRKVAVHSGRVGALDWNGDLLASGSRDNSVFVSDIRCPESEGVTRLNGHKQEVCGLRWSYDQKTLASGGNDNKLLLWDAAKSDSPLMRFSSHTAAVKALSWSPHERGLLASGGGTADRCIRFWNTHSGEEVNWIDTDSQVCNLIWSRNANEIVSTHGYSLNHIVVWKYPSMTKLATLTGHTFRVLYLSKSTLS
jgi:cell division cycle 20-like protein 1 (cofactor of APC complex)